MNINDLIPTGNVEIRIFKKFSENLGYDISSIRYLLGEPEWQCPEQVHTDRSVYKGCAIGWRREDPNLLFFIFAGIDLVLPGSRRLLVVVCQGAPEEIDRVSEELLSKGFAKVDKQEPC